MMFLFAELTKEIIFVCTIFLFIYAVTDLCTDFDICPDLRYECSHKICLHYAINLRFKNKVTIEFTLAI